MISLTFRNDKISARVVIHEDGSIILHGTRAGVIAGRFQVSQFDTDEVMRTAHNLEKQVARLVLEFIHQPPEKHEVDMFESFL